MGKIIKTVTDGKQIIFIHLDEDGIIRSSDGKFYSNPNDFEDAFDVYLCSCGYKETSNGGCYEWGNYYENVF